MDAVWILLALVFFAASWGLVVLFDRLKQEE
jgi:hypothetical protein